MPHQKRQIIEFGEADGQTHDGQEALKSITEELSFNCIFIYTLNNMYKMEKAIVSRSACFYVDPITYEDYLPWFEKACRFAKITYSAEVPQQIYSYYKGDLRRVISDFLEVYKGTHASFFKMNMDYAEEIYNAKDPVEKFLSITKNTQLDLENLLQELYVLNGYNNAKIFTEASIALGHLSNKAYYPIIMILREGLNKK